MVLGASRNTRSPEPQGARGFFFAAAIRRRQRIIIPIVRAIARWPIVKRTSLPLKRHQPPCARGANKARKPFGPFSLAHALERLRRAIHYEELERREGEDWSVAKDYVRSLLRRMNS